MASKENISEKCLKFKYLNTLFRTLYNTSIIELYNIIHRNIKECRGLDKVSTLLQFTMNNLLYLFSH